jgi:hypothetical protein
LVNLVCVKTKPFAQNFICVLSKQRRRLDSRRAPAKAHRPARHPPPLDTFEAALNADSAEVAVVRREGLTRDLSNDAVERLFALGFTLEQMHQHFMDLACCVTEFARESTT